MADQHSYPVVIRGLPQAHFQEKKDLAIFVKNILANIPNEDRQVPQIRKQRSMSEADKQLNAGTQDFGEILPKDRVRRLYVPLPQSLIRPDKEPPWRTKTDEIDDLASMMSSISLSQLKDTNKCDAIVEFLHKNDADTFGRCCESEHHFQVDLLSPIFTNVEAKLNHRLGQILDDSKEFQEFLWNKSGVKILHSSPTIKLVGEEWQIDLAKYYIHATLETVNSKPSNPSQETKLDLPLCDESNRQQYFNGDQPKHNLFIMNGDANSDLARQRSYSSPQPDTEEKNMDDTKRNEHKPYSKENGSFKIGADGSKKMKGDEEVAIGSEHYEASDQSGKLSVGNDTSDRDGDFENNDLPDSRSSSSTSSWVKDFQVDSSPSTLHTDSGNLEHIQSQMRGVFVSTNHPKQGGHQDPAVNMVSAAHVTPPKVAKKKKVPTATLR